MVARPRWSGAAPLELWTGMDRFEEPLEVLEALKANYSAADDLEKVVAVHRLQEELAELCRVREDEVAGIVRSAASALQVFCCSLGTYWPLREPGCCRPVQPERREGGRSAGCRLRSGRQHQSSAVDKRDLPTARRA